MTQATSPAVRQLQRAIRRALILEYLRLVLYWALLGATTAVGVITLVRVFGPLWGNLAGLPLGYVMVRLGQWARG